MNISRFRDYLEHYCSPIAAKQVGWDVVGMRAHLFAVASQSDMQLVGGYASAARILGLSEERWQAIRDRVMEGWQETREGGPIRCLMPYTPKRRATTEKAKGAFAVRAEYMAQPVGLPLFDGPAQPAEGRAAAEPSVLDDFEKFWAQYPKKSGLSDARKAYLRIAPDADTFERIMADIAIRRYSRKWNDQGGRFVANATTYLNGQMWNEQVELSDAELAASVVYGTKKELYDFHTKDPRSSEVQSWVVSQRMLGLIPTQADLCRRLGVRYFAPEVAGVLEAQVVSPYVEVLPANVVAAPTEDLDQMLFREELQYALSSQSESTAKRIRAKSINEQRAWLDLWKKANQERAASDSAPSYEQVISRVRSSPRALGPTEDVQDVMPR